MSYICHAVPAITGKPCLHNNTTVKTVKAFNKGLLCCEKCGCTKIASDKRLNKKLNKG